MVGKIKCCDCIADDMIFEYLRSVVGLEPCFYIL
jgi:hypothetical protein